MTAAELSRQIDFSPSYVAKAESGALEPSVKAIARMAFVLKLNDQELSTMIKAAAWINE